MKNGSDAAAELPRNSAAEPTTELPDWNSPNSTMLDDFEALLEAAERVTKLSCDSMLSCDSNLSPDSKPSCGSGHEDSRAAAFSSARNSQVTG